MAMASSTTLQKLTLADVLLGDGLITKAQHEEAIRKLEATKGSMVRILTEMGALSDEARIDILRRRTNLEVVNLKDAVPRADVVGFLTRSQCKKAHLVPLRMDETSVLVAMEDPTDVRQISDIEQAFGKSVRPVLASAKDIADTIERLPEASQTADTEDSKKTVASRLALVGMCFGPIIAFFAFVSQTAVGRDWLSSLGLNAFESILFFVISFGSWAAMSWFLHDLMFGKKSGES